MSHQRIWFGTTRQAMWLPTPSAGMDASSEGYSEDLRYQNGGFGNYRSRARARSYGFEWTVGQADGVDGLWNYEDYANGLHGGGFLYFTDPYAAATNALSAVWSSPGLIEQGHKNIAATAPTFVTTAANSYRYPSRTAAFTLNQTTAPTGKNQAMTLLVPPGYRAHIGGIGTSTGTATVDVNGTALVLGTTSAAPSFSLYANGDDVPFIELSLRGTGTLNLTALWVQILPLGKSPSMPQFESGKGSTGLEFNGSAIAQSFVYNGNGERLISLASPLVEVEAWARPRRFVTPVPIPEIAVVYVQPEAPELERVYWLDNDDPSVPLAFSGDPETAPTPPDVLITSENPVDYDGQFIYDPTTADLKENLAYNG